MNNEDRLALLTFGALRNGTRMDKIPNDGIYGGYVSRLPNGGDPEDIVSKTADEILIKASAENLMIRFTLDDRVLYGTFKRDKSVSEGYYSGSIKRHGDASSIALANAWLTIYWFDKEFFFHGEWLEEAVTYGLAIELGKPRELT